MVLRGVCVSSTEMSQTFLRISLLGLYIDVGVKGVARCLEPRLSSMPRGLIHGWQLGITMS